MKKGKFHINVFFKKVFKFIYPITIIIFLIIILFLNENSLYNQYWIFERLKILNKEKQKIQVEIEKNKKILYKIENDSFEIEKIAREKYFLARENEIIILINQTSSK